MKTKLPLLFLFFFAMGMSVLGQDTIRSLVITEWRGDWEHNAYIELTNMGDTELDLSEFTIGLFVNGNSYADQDPQRFTRLEGMLPAGESFVISAHAQGSEDWIDGGYPKIHPKILNVTDMEVYFDETDNRLIAAGLDPADDSISPGYGMLMNVNRGERAHFLFHHPTATDSVVVDGVGLVFDPTDGSLIFDQYKDVAGIFNATETHILVRKFSVKEGNPDWKLTRGATPEESQWMPIPFATGWYNRYSGDYNLAGNHGVYTVNDNSMKGKAGVAIDIDFSGQTITLPWGTLRDTVELTPWQLMDLGDGLAWQYIMTSVREDSAHSICQTGDVLTVYAVGNELQTVDFNLSIAPPTNDMNLVFPVRTINSEGYYTMNQYYDVTQNDPVIDTILGVPFATRVDTLLKRLEKAADASWEIEWVDGNVRTDIKNGDKLIVTAANGDKKEYYISVEDYEPNHNASLAAITWPEIPEYIKGENDWKGDTIPNFLPGGLVYEITVPYGVNTIPALVANPQNTNARVEMSRAVSLSGSIEDRTTLFTVYAEDDTTYKEYKVIFKKEILQEWIQPFSPDPFISQVGRHIYFTNFWTEIFNPGNQDLDLSKYMLTLAVNDMTPSQIVQYEPTFANRYVKYIPGYKYSDDELVYVVDPSLREDLSVDPIVKPGDTWLFGQFADREARKMPYLEEITDFHLSPTVENVWGITYDGEAQVSQHTYRKWAMYLFKIKNDSILDGTKLPNDPNDFELIDMFGRNPNPDKIQYDPAGIDPTAWKQGFAASRKETIWKGNPESGGSFGTNPDDSEWTRIRWKGIYDASTTNLDQWEWCAEGLGIHSVLPITVYKSTVSSLSYLVSDGYQGEQTIDGVESGTTVNQFLDNIIKADPDQYLKVSSTSDGSERTGDEALALNDTLVVTSADSANITRYILNVGDPLDNNAVLTSDTYTINISGAEGTIEGMEYGVSISSVLDNITVPSTATLNIINADNELIPLLILNSDTAYVQTKVHDNVYFEVVAQNGTTRIKYHLSPQAQSSDAFVLSDIYEVNQLIFFINYINNNTSVSTFLANIIPVKGATVRVLDKLGYERQYGQLAYDDVLEVTSENKEVQNFYYLGFKAELMLQSADAYVVSDVYKVDQINLSISDDGLTGEVSVADFMDMLSAAPGASFIVADADGNEVTSGNMALGYQVVVTSENGLVQVTYAVELNTTSVELSGSETIRLYPNPFDDLLYIKGLPEGANIHVYNMLGRCVKVIPYNQYEGMISMGEMDNGLYLIKVESGNHVYTYKVYKR